MKLAFLSEKVYDKVTIRFYDVFFISNFKKRPDGKYEAVVSMSQKFTGEGDRPYSDVVQKEHTDHTCSNSKAGRHVLRSKTGGYFDHG